MGGLILFTWIGESKEGGERPLTLWADVEATLRLLR